MSFSTIKNIYELIFKKEIISAVLGALITSLITWYVFKKNSNKEISRERLEKVFYPVYTSLEKHLYKFDKNNIEFIYALNKAGEIIKNNRLLTGNKLYSQYTLIENCDTNIAKKINYKQFCSMLIREYNKSCRKIGLPIITISYRMGYKQCTKFQCILWKIIYVLAVIGLCTLFISVYLIITFAIMIILDNNGQLH